MVHMPGADSVVAADSVIVAGGGLAAHAFASALRSAGFSGELTVVAPRPGFDRPPLSKELFTRNESLWLAESLGIDLTALADRLIIGHARTARLVDGSWQLETSAAADDSGEQSSTVHAAQLVVATGSTPFVPPAWTGAIALAEPEHAAAIRALAAAGPLRAAVIGGGWLAAEVTSSLALAGHRVTWFDPRAHVLAAHLGGLVGERMTQWFTDAGVTRLAGARVAAVLPDRRVTTLADGATSQPFDLVIAATGSRPATDWLAGVEGALTAGGHVATDDLSRAELPGLWALGDSALRRDPVWGPQSGGHWDEALRQPQRAASALVAPDGPIGPAAPPYVFSSILGHELALVGSPALAGGLSDGPIGQASFLTGAQVTIEDQGSGWTAEYRDPGTGALTAVLAVDAPRAVGRARKLLRRGPASA